MTAYSLGTLTGSTPVIKNDFSLSEVDSTDVFKFQSIGTENINLSLTDISIGDNADLRLFRDVNSNGILDVTDRISGLVASSSRSDNFDEAINVKAGAGTYFAEVFRSTSFGGVTYDLALSATTPKATGDFSNLLPKEVEVGRVGSDITLTGAVNDSNTAQVYSFSLNSFNSVNLRLSGLTNDADIRVIKDSNNNRIVDAGEEVGRSTNGHTSAETISNIADPGSYFVQVNQYSGNTNYTLAFDHSRISFTIPS
jgi:hypothetical protein